MNDKTIYVALTWVPLDKTSSVETINLGNLRAFEHYVQLDDFFSVVHAQVQWFLEIDLQPSMR